MLVKGQHDYLVKTLIIVEIQRNQSLFSTKMLEYSFFFFLQFRWVSLSTETGSGFSCRYNGNQDALC